VDVSGREPLTGTPKLGCTTRNHTIFTSFVIHMWKEMWMFREKNKRKSITNHVILNFGDLRLNDILPPSVLKFSDFTFVEMHGVMLPLPSALGSSFQCFSSWHGLEEAGYKKPAWSSKSKAFADFLPGRLTQRL